MTYTTKAGDTWDGIAAAVYGSEYHADLLMAANRRYLTVYRFDAGVTLEVPVLQEKRDGLLPPWKFEADYGD